MIIPGYDIDQIQTEQFDHYIGLLIEWNKKFNLTAITDPEEIIIKHFADSLSISNLFDLTQYHSVIDVGTGAGFPGIPLKICYPNLKLTLLDSLNKRIEFLNYVISELGLSNVECIHGRAEELGHNDCYREKYDLCVSRAVANLSSLSELCIPFVKVGGYFVSYKGDKAKEEYQNAENAITLLGCSLDKSYQYDLIMKEQIGNRTLLSYIKNVSTVDKYPRRAGIPVKRPL